MQDLDASTSLAAIDALNPVTFNWIDPTKSSGRSSASSPSRCSLFPNLVSTTSPTALTPDGTLSLNYIGLISPIVAAIQQLDKEITSLASTVAGFAQRFRLEAAAFERETNELCVGSTCVTPAQFQAMVAAANQSATAPASPSSSTSDATDTPPVIRSTATTPPSSKSARTTPTSARRSPARRPTSTSGSRRSSTACSSATSNSTRAPLRPTRSTTSYRSDGSQALQRAP